MSFPTAHELGLPPMSPVRKCEQCGTTVPQYYVTTVRDDRSRQFVTRCWECEYASWSDFRLGLLRGMPKPLSAMSSRRD